MRILTRLLLAAALGAIALATFVLRGDEGDELDWYTGGQHTVETYWEQRAADWRATYEPD